MFDISGKTSRRRSVDIGILADDQQLRKNGNRNNQDAVNIILYAQARHLMSQVTEDSRHELKSAGLLPAGTVAITTQLTEEDDETSYVFDDTSSAKRERDRARKDQVEKAMSALKQKDSHVIRPDISSVNAVYWNNPHLVDCMKRFGPKEPNWQVFANEFVLESKKNPLVRSFV